MQKKILYYIIRSNRDNFGNESVGINSIFSINADILITYIIINWHLCQFIVMSDIGSLFI